MRAVQVAFILIGVTALAYWFLAGPEEQVSQIPSKPNPAIVEVVIPETLSANAQIGKAAFEAVCASCHGVNAVGQLEVAPPLVHVLYEPSHHGDEAFQRAVANGVRAHHWPFGSMPPVEGLTRGDVQMIVAYVREMQRANGIE
ncbi:cytochrome c [uncultured Boseongicola sp.]|jgi:mono/diheme cytochrome c family protein|uniref:c-type cytochrome n=1 Tax=uncultured Boseongicola sp. TaxID=1648499 RepID=UPI00261EFAA7|nr:cytochrome c [uncultured Boseongicola sp.]